MKIRDLFIFTTILFACHANPVATPGEVGAAKEKAVQTSLREPSPIGSRSATEMVAAGYKRYGVEKGILYYRLDGAVKGLETIYFDHWGWREAKYINTNTQVGTYKEETNKVTYLFGEKRYEYDPASNSAQWFESPQVEEAAKKYGTKDMTLVGDEMIKKMGGKKVRTEIFAGVECDVWEIEQYKTTLWMWKGLTLKERSKMDNIPIGRTCLIIDQEKPIPEEKLAIPQKATLEKAN